MNTIPFIGTDNVRSAFPAVNVNEFLYHLTLNLFTSGDSIICRILVGSDPVREAAFTGKWQEIFMLAVITLDPGKAQMEVTTVQIFIYDVQYIWTPIPIILLVPIIPFAYQFLEMCYPSLIFL